MASGHKMTPDEARQAVEAEPVASLTDARERRVKLERINVAVARALEASEKARDKPTGPLSQLFGVTTST
jgi:hypothetical protein